MMIVIAVRNLARNRRRTSLSILIVSVGIAALLLTAGFVRNAFAGLRDAVIQGGLGHLEVGPFEDSVTTASLADRSGHPPAMREWRALRAVLEGRPEVRAAGAAIQFAGVATDGDASVSFIGLAVEPDRERRMGMDVKLRAGKNLSDAAPADGDRVLLGVGLARTLRARPGDTVTLMAATSDGSLNAVDMTVEGVFTTGFQDLDGRMLKTHVTTAQRLLGTELVTSIIVELHDTSTTPRVADDLRRVLAVNVQPLSVQTWQERAPFYNQVRALYASIFVFLGAIVAILVALATSNTMLMSLLERVREFGMLLAIGTSRGQLGQLLVCEALWLAVFSGVAGVTLGLSLSSIINFLRIEMPPPPGAADPILLTLTVVPTDVLLICISMTVILVAAAVPPTWRVFRLRIVDALGHV